MDSYLRPRWRPVGQWRMRHHDDYDDYDDHDGTAAACAAAAVVSSA